MSAIETGRLTPSVEAALAVAGALGCSVEELFGGGVSPAPHETPCWAWEAQSEATRPEATRYWEAEVGGKRMLFPAEAVAGGGWAHDGVCRAGVLHPRPAWAPERTLVMASCDPAAGLLATECAAAGFRLLAICRGGAAALDLLKRRAVHVAGLHRSTEDKPERNRDTVRERLGQGYRLLRSAEWREGLALPADNRHRSVAACLPNVRKWAPREPGSAARECLDELVGHPLGGRGVHRSHQEVAAAVKGGWADAGICVQLCAEEAGLRFLPVRWESFDLVFEAGLEHDPRLQALIRLLRSRDHRRLIDELPGYSARHTGETTAV